jgi:hypothetical protein
VTLLTPTPLLPIPGRAIAVTLTLPVTVLVPVPMTAAAAITVARAGFLAVPVGAVSRAGSVAAVVAAVGLRFALSAGVAVGRPGWPFAAVPHRGAVGTLGTFGRGFGHFRGWWVDLRVGEGEALRRRR